MYSPPHQLAVPGLDLLGRGGPAAGNGGGGWLTG